MRGLRYRVSHGIIVLPILADMSSRFEKAAKLFDIPPQRQNRISVRKLKLRLPAVGGTSDRHCIAQNYREPH